MPKTTDLIKQLVTADIVPVARADELKKLPYAEDVFNVLREDKTVDQEKLTEQMAGYYHLKYADLGPVQVDKEVINLLPEDLAQNYQMVVFGKESQVWKVGLVNPRDLKGQEAVDFLARQLGFQIDYYLISPTSFRQVIKQYSVLKTEIKKALDLAEEKMTKSSKKEQEMSEDEKTEEVIKSAPISQIVSVIIRHGVEGKASDIHIEPFVDKSRVRYRIDGALHTSLVLPKAVHAAIISRIKVMANLKIDETRIPQDGRIRLKVNNNDVDFRISTLPLYDQEKVVMRILDTSSTNFTLEKLGFDGKNLEIISNNIDKPHGMFLVTGPTGSGKSTTLYAVLNILNQEDVNIITLEDPVEYYLKGVNQSQINPDVGLTFAAGLRSILRQDPDVIMVGEIRDNETAELAIHAALTGHIVLSTLHTNDSFGAIPRLIDMHVEPFLLVSTVNVIIAQRLVRKNCEKCKEEYQIPANLVDFVWEEFSKIPKEYIVPELEHIKTKKDMKFYHGKGCPVCASSGYAGRLAIAEVLDMVDKLKQMISSGESLEKVRQEVVARNLCTLQQDGVLKALRGQTTVEEIMRATKE
ncbi:MAG: GspE/PulE family protein [Patescibacteria group bacterium]|nr:GspE/PulE family protein [Patescibacteria group bacterium]